MRTQLAQPSVATTSQAWTPNERRSAARMRDVGAAVCDGGRSDGDAQRRACVSHGADASSGDGGPSALCTCCAASFDGGSCPGTTGSSASSNASPYARAGSGDARALSDGARGLPDDGRVKCGGSRRRPSDALAPSTASAGMAAAPRARFAGRAEEPGALPVRSARSAAAVDRAWSVAPPRGMWRSRTPLRRR